MGGREGEVSIDYMRSVSEEDEDEEVREYSCFQNVGSHALVGLAVAIEC